MRVFLGTGCVGGGAAGRRIAIWTAAVDGDADGWGWGLDFVDIGYVGRSLGVGCRLCLCCCIAVAVVVMVRRGPWVMYGLCRCGCAARSVYDSISMSETFYYYYCLGFLSNVYGPTVRIYDCF